MTQQPQSVPLRGGLNLVDAPITKKPSSLLGVRNYEPRPEGYRRIDGIERFDGQQQPSKESYWTIGFDSAANQPTIGRMVKGMTSGATGILQEVVIEAGSYAGGDAAGYLVLRSVTGTFQDNEPLGFVEPVAFSSGFSGGFR